MSTRQSLGRFLGAVTMNITTQTISTNIPTLVTAIKNSTALFGALKLSSPRSSSHFGALKLDFTAMRARQIDFNRVNTRLALLLTATLNTLVAAR